MTLDISHNGIRCLKPLRPLRRLRHLIATHNAIASLAGVAACAALNKLDVAHNELVTLSAAAGAASCPLLGSLNLSGNAVRDVVDYRLHLVHLLPQVRSTSGTWPPQTDRHLVRTDEATANPLPQVASLDNVRVDEREKVHALNLHGADAGGLKAVRERYFARGELDDGGGAIPPMAAGLLPSAGEEVPPGGKSPEDFGHVDALVDSVPLSALASGLLTFADFLQVRPQLAPHAHS